MESGIQVITRPFIPVDDFDSFTVLGDPGCDGLGAEIVSTFARGLRDSPDVPARGGNFHLVVGDIVPSGSRLFYRNMTDLVNTVADRPVFMVCGNHDTDYYDSYFGRKDYALADRRTLIVVLDNSKRLIADQSLELLSQALEHHRRPNVILAMHIPPPNRVSSNAIPAEEWAKISALFAPCRDQLKYIICGHLHSYFEDTLEGTRLIVSGGAGARIEEEPGIQAPYNHVVDFFYDAAGILSHKKRDIHPAPEPYEDPRIRTMLFNAFSQECMAHVRYKLYAEDAEKRGMKNTAKLFRAAADSEWYHAKNFYYTMPGLQEPLRAIDEAVENERREVDRIYKECLDYAREQKLGLPAYAFTDALMAEKVHLGLFQDARKQLEHRKDILDESYFTCSSCGYTFSGTEHPKNCPVCGAPADKIIGPPIGLVQ
ncbi:MAG: metallophosphoesterase [Spirochaetaceae bacterium]|jgi:rubrerythrin|nr:metallophosphoesterase [Spirochaetaceae bacterium]